MPDNVYAHVITCAATTPSTAPQEVLLTGMDAVKARKWTVTIPDGHAGLTGIGLAFGHNVVLPSNAGAFLSGNDHTFEFDLEDYPDGVQWSVFVCNLDIIPHVWQSVFEGDNLDNGEAPVPPMPLTTGQLAVAQAAALGGP